jgi:hypothetical protein
MEILILITCVVVGNFLAKAIFKIDIVGDIINKMSDK